MWTTTMENKTMGWCSLEEGIQRIAEQRFERAQEKYLQARAVADLDKCTKFR